MAKNNERTIYSELKKFAGYVEIGENSIIIPIKEETIESKKQKSIFKRTLECAHSVEYAPCESVIAYLLQQISILLNSH